MATALVNKPFGCSHYKRKCMFVSPCCKKVYTCRFCHDEQETHILNRKAITEIICMICTQRQRSQRNCDTCEVRFGKYVCLECNLFDDEDKGQFHCKPCGICRVGGDYNFFHCEKCNMCLNVALISAHKCVENMSHTDCPVCLEDLHSSRITLHIPKCGHPLHKPCLEELEKASHSVCPICKKELK